MATPNQKLADSLTQLQRLQQDGRRVFQSKELTRLHRERLLQQGFIQEVMKGWLISSSPSARSGDSTPWYACFWEFCARYCAERFGDERRTVFSGIRAADEPEQLLGRQVIVVANLAPRKMRFGVSQGMVLCASGEGDGAVYLIEAAAGARPGMKVS